MGQIRFRLHDRDRISPAVLDRISVAGMEEIPWSTRARVEGDQLVVERSMSDSGFVSIPWQVEGHGTRVLSTSTLIERERPYLLEVELARGLLHRIRSRLFMWETLGLATSDELKEQLRSATREFSLAATSQNEPPEATVAANRSISLAMSAGEALVASYAKQAIAARRKQAPVTTLMGVNMGDDTPSVALRQQLADACNIVQLPISWRTIEQTEGKREWKATEVQLSWAQKAGLKVAAGPLLQMDQLGTPDWMVLWEGDFENLARVALEHVHAVVSRYAGRVHLWHVASRINTGKLMQLEEEQRLHLVAQALDVVRKIDPRTPTVVSFDQPWAEYMSQQDEDLAPLHYADALVRADLGISGFGLEVNAGFSPRGTGHRAVFELGRMLDQWSIWGLPLMLSVTTASSAEADPNAHIKADIDLAKLDAEHPQREWAASVLPLLLARSAVQVVLWNQLTDSQPHDYPNAGIFDARNQAKPTLSLMRDLRKTCLA